MKCDDIIKKIKEGLESIKKESKAIEDITNVIKKLRPCDNTRENYDFMVKQTLIMAERWNDMAHLLTKQQKNTIRTLKLENEGRIPK